MIEARDEQKHKKWCGLWPAVDEESWSRSSKALFFSSYLFFGVLHELAHVATARSLGYQNESLSLSFFVGILLGRVSVIPSLEFASAWEIALVRHAGWLASFVILAFLFLADRLVAQSSRRRNKRGISRMFLGAAAVTFLEALSTDLIGFGVARSKASSKILFFCGNFGIIMLNDSWVNTSGDYGKTVLDLLEKMISITMMRGGEYYGVIRRRDVLAFFQPSPTQNSCHSSRCKSFISRRLLSHFYHACHFSSSWRYCGMDSSSGRLAYACPGSGGQ